MSIKVKIKKLHNFAPMPKYAKGGDACFDLTATSINNTEKYLEYGTGLAMEIPKGYVGLLYSRSSITLTDLMLKNGVGVIDSGYRGEVKFRFTKLPSLGSLSEEEIIQHEGVYRIGERVGQMMILPLPPVHFEVVDELSHTDRGEGGYGSTGN